MDGMRRDDLARKMLRIMGLEDICCECATCMRKAYSVLKMVKAEFVQDRSWRIGRKGREEGVDAL
jgi:hypothetical protein